VEISKRKMEILRAVIEDYIATAIPVGSRTISRKYVSDISAATIRNEMSDLEELGYLVSPHTSAGRIPADKAYRLYVDHMLKSGTLKEEEVKFMYSQLERQAFEMEHILRRSAGIISQLTNYTSMVLSPQVRRSVLKRIQLVPINSGMALAVIITNTAVVKDAVIKVPHGITDEDLYRISQVLTQRFEGCALTDINISSIVDLQEDIDRYRGFFRDLLGVVENSMMQSEGTDIAIDGAVNIFNLPEYQDIERAKAFLQVINAPHRLEQLLSQRTKRDFYITIGEENGEKELNDCSIVTVTYRVGNRPMGAIGVIGPTRMDYGRVLGVLDFASKRLGKIITMYIDENADQ